MPRTDPRENLGYLVADLGRLFGRVFDRRVAHLGLTRV
ncbi:MAG: MarR family transcriptional regulator, partial [Xanthomonadaceae bacterium]|nr:MarR family transcriptional regulator [Xanthomonadaceae bacterium]